MSEGSSNMSPELPPDPDYITYLLDPEQDYNCYFVVGNPSLDIASERIGVVKKMLLAHSLVLRAELKESKIAEKGDVPVTDMYPDTFKNLLRYTYGYDNTESLTFDEADNLLYAAEKYMMVKLKNKLATCLMSMLNSENICSLMNNPACYKVLDLNCAITQILQFETEKVLANPQFLDLSPDAFLKILEQDTLDVDEIELWRSAVKWGKKRTSSEDGSTIRVELAIHLRHIRVCSLSYEELCSEVLPTEVLTYDEFKMVCQSHKSGEIQPSLTSVCNVIEKRSRPEIKSELLTADITKEDTSVRVYSSSLQDLKLSLSTFDKYLEICSVELARITGTAHRCSGSITFDDDSGSPITVSFNEQLDKSHPWCIPSRKSGMNVLLGPENCYYMKIKFTCGSKHATHQSSRDYFENDHMIVDYDYLNSHYLFNILKINYRVVTKQ